MQHCWSCFVLTERLLFPALPHNVVLAIIGPCIKSQYVWTLSRKRQSNILACLTNYIIQSIMLSSTWDIRNQMYECRYVGIYVFSNSVYTIMHKFNTSQNLGTICFTYCTKLEAIYTLYGCSIQYWPRVPCQDSIWRRNIYYTHVEITPISDRPGVFLWADYIIRSQRYSVL